MRVPSRADGCAKWHTQHVAAVAARTSAAVVAAAADNALHLKSCGRYKRRTLTMYVPAAYGRRGVGAWLSRTSVVLNVAWQIEFVKHKSREKEIKT